jgi:ribosomal protein S11
MGIAECLDALYKLAKDRSSEQAIQEAVKIGEKKAEEKLVKESKTTVTGGGKSSGSAVPDFNKIDDVVKLREIVSQLHGVADRD